MEFGLCQIYKGQLLQRKESNTLAIKQSESQNTCLLFPFPVCLSFPSSLFTPFLSAKDFHILGMCSTSRLHLWPPNIFLIAGAINVNLDFSQMKAGNYLFQCEWNSSTEPRDELHARDHPGKNKVQSIFRQANKIDSKQKCMEREAPSIHPQRGQKVELGVLKQFLRFGCPTPSGYSYSTPDSTDCIVSFSLV